MLFWYFLRLRLYWTSETKSILKLYAKFLIFGPAAALKPGEEEEDGLSEWLNNDAVCKAAPGFARVC